MGTGVATLGGAGSTRTVTVSNGTLQVGSIAANGSMGFTKSGPGLLMAGSAVSKFGGLLNISAGTYGVGANDSYVAGGVAGSGTVIDGSGTIRWFIVLGHGGTFSGNFTNGSTAGLGLRKDGPERLPFSPAQIPIPIGRR